MNYRSDWKDTNHYEISTDDDPFFWSLDDIKYEIESSVGGMVCDMPAHKILGEMMDVWCKWKNGEIK